MVKDTFVKFCPNCHPTDITLEKTNPLQGIVGIFNYICNNCGYLSKIFPEIKKSEVKHLNLVLSCFKPSNMPL